jgi:hypothetical protein
MASGIIRVHVAGCVYCLRLWGHCPHAYLAAARCATFSPQPAVTKRIPQPRSELSPSVRAHEAKLLTVMLRTSRLTWVFGEPGTDKSALLKTGVMPLLQRRSGDRGGVPAATAFAVAAQERRRRPARPRGEVAIYVDDWGMAPLSALRRGIMGVVPAAAAEVGDHTLTSMLQLLHQRLGLHFVFLLDRFEEYLALAPNEGEVGQFASELVEAILREDLPASFLVAMDEAARPRLARFRARIPGFDHDVLRLSPVAEQREPVVDWPRTAANRPAQTPKPRRPPPRAPVKVEDVYALIESTLSRSSGRNRSADLQCDVDLEMSPAASTSDQPLVDTAQPVDNKLVD